MLYIHIPFCKGKCIYCNFYSGGNPDWKKYLKAVVNELDSRINELGCDSLSSLYIGGGTPSLIPEEEFELFLHNIHECLEKQGKKLREDIEFTIEVNPEDVSPEKIEIWKKGGVNRVSMGVQSLNDKELQAVHRRHNAARARNALSLLSESFENISVDIIYGLPFQTLESLSETIEEVLKYRPTHVSVYSLTFEDGTPMEILRKNGKFTEPSEDDYLAMSAFTEEKLESNGFIRYEISNYARGNYRSRHNSGYWSGKAYLGLGPSASSYDGKTVRRNNPADLKSYMNYYTCEPVKEHPFFKEERLSREELIEERVFLSLRTKEGLEISRFRKEFGDDVTERLIKIGEEWKETGHITTESGRCLRLSRKGFDISDYIILSIVGKLQL